MSRKFKIVYYFLVVLLTLVFSYQVYQLIDVFLEEPDPNSVEFIADEE